MTAYYNEIDPSAAQWLRNLIEAGHIAPGDVDERSIEDVTPGDLAGYTQCHFFAGIGVWSYALRRAGWPDDLPVWKGSCPCQPFSSAGTQAGFDDERHLWPHFQWLIEQCRPAVVFGEQVASKAVEPWIDLVQTDLEGLGYAFAGIPFPSAGVGAPHIRDRLFWVGHSNIPGLEGHAGHGGAEGRERPGGSAATAGVSGGLGACEFCGYEFDHDLLGKYGCPNCEGSGLADSTECRRREKRPDAWRGAAGDRAQGFAAGPVPGGANSGLADAGGNGRDQRGQRVCSARSDGLVGDHGILEGQPPAGPVNGFWGAADWLLCRDEKWRPVEPGTFPLVDGAPARVVRLRAYGNAINAEAAREFIEGVMGVAGVAGGVGLPSL